MTVWRRSRWRVVMAALAACVCACGSDGEGDAHPIAVLSAFPAEMAPLLERATIEATTEINGRIFRIGQLGGVPVVIGLTGIGLVNAATTTRLLLERFTVAGVVVSGVTGSFLRIGDVAVPVTWALPDGDSYPAQPEWLDLVRQIAASGTVVLEHCTTRPLVPEEPVCLLHTPAIVAGGIGHSSDPFGGAAFPCQPNGNDVFGCDVTAAGAASLLGPGHVATTGSAAPAAEDMETAAIAREAARRGVPFIAFRAVSDGAGDPLNLPGFPAQFFAYYRLAAHNAAAATAAFLDRLPGDRLQVTGNRE